MKILKAGLLVALLFLFLLTGWRAYEFQERPEFCNLCHGVEIFYETWFHSAHRPVTNCKDCHIPQDIREFFWSPRYGIRDFYAYFLGDTPDLYRAKPPTPRIVRENCIRCHEALLRELPLHERLECQHCHRQTPHRL
ncbi:NapC/NirT family cytochrome c [Dethiobacter alkaliphilus]|uniref:NapC/NirT family cytochrome c n=1 Tax=Dethiobacter alkaliphilus TaxID=427926 RepID=UPI000A051588